MTSSLSGWVERPQLHRQHSSEKVIQQVVGSGGGHAVLRPWSAESAVATKSQYRPVRSLLPELESPWPLLTHALCRQGSLPLPLLCSPSSKGGPPATAPAKIPARTHSDSLSLPPVFSSPCPPLPGHANLSVLAEPARAAVGDHEPKHEPLQAPSRLSCSPSLKRPAAQCRWQNCHHKLAATESAKTSAASSPVDTTGQPRASGGCPPFGCKGACGRRSQMQDAHTAIQNFAHVTLPASVSSLHKWPPTLNPAPSTVPNGSSVSDREAGEELHISTFHYFGVYDGHGGAAASSFCANQLHSLVLASLGGTLGYEYNRRNMPQDQKEDEGESVQLLGQRAESRAGNFVPQPVSLESIEQALLDAFQRVDKEVLQAHGRQGAEEYAGSTAVVALVSDTQLLIANCGDSRAVLLRGGKAVQLSSDQTASREDEIARIEGKGGEIYYLQDCARVMGVLAMSRSIGDNYLHPYVIPDPESTFIPRSEDDELLILGTDGLWDKISNQDACDLASRCLERAKAKGLTRRSAAKCAATVLIKSAVSKGSRDNVTVVVVDLRSNEAYESSC